MAFVNKLTNMTYKSKEDAIKEFENNFLIEQQEDNKIEVILKEIKSVVNSADVVEVLLIEKLRYSIKVKSEVYNIDAYLNLNDNFDDWGGIYFNIDDVVNFFKFATETVREILNKVGNRYEFQFFEFSRYHDDYGNGHYFDFTYKTIDDENSDREYQITYDVTTTVDDFIKQLDQHFVTALEGFSSELNDEGYFVGFTINGIPIQGLLDKANKLNKKVRLEIVE